MARASTPPGCYNGRSMLRTLGPPARVAAGLLLVLAVAPGSSAADPYDDYRVFADSAFGGAVHPLAAERYGAELLPPYDWWEYVSQSSASIGFSTNHLVVSWVEYGATGDYGERTPASDGRYSKHLHHVTGLRPGKVCHYRVVLEGVDGQRVVSEDRVLTPVETEGAIWIPDDLAGPPYVLGLPNARYLVTEDIVAPRTAFEVTAAGVTLDLGGHTVTYDQVPMTISGNWSVYRKESSFGVVARSANDLTVVNGVLRQGAAQSAAHERNSIGFNPIYGDRCSDFEMAGVELEYGGAQMVGLFLHWPGGENEIHHNVFRDRGWEILYRHGMGSRAMGSVGELAGLEVHHNLVARTRHMGFNGARVYDNEIHIDSYATNGYGLPALSHHREGYRNRIYGTGYHVVGFGWGNGNHWHDNLVHLVGQGPDFRYPEYGNQESLNGFRLTQYAGAKEELRGSLVERNLVIIEGGGCSDDGECTQARGLQYFSDPYVLDNLIRDNVLSVVMADGVTQAAALVTQGDPKRCGTEAPVRYLNNTLISNVMNVRMGDYYGAGCNHRFFDTRIVRVGDRADYRTFAFDTRRPTNEQYFFDTVLEGGASYESVEFLNPEQEMLVGWTVAVRVLDGKEAVRGAIVRVRDGEGTVVQAGTTGPQGTWSAPVVAWSQRRAGRVERAPFTVEVMREDRTITRSLSLEGPVELEVRLTEGAGRR